MRLSCPWLVVIGSFLMAGLACDSTGNGQDGGPHDAGAIGDSRDGGHDAGSVDAGSVDAGSADAGMTDAGSEDAGTLDAGMTDAGTPDAGTPHAGASLNSARILFSGHSLLDNPLADYVHAIARNRGKSSDWQQQIGIGSPLRVRTWGNGNWAGYRQGKNRSGSNLDILAELREPRTLSPGERYDHLVVTDRHDIPEVIRWEGTVPYLRHYHDRLIAANPSARTYFYHTWLELDMNDPSAWIAYEKQALGAWECSASKVNLTLQAEGRNDRVYVLPGGAALVDLVERILANQVSGISGTTHQKLSVLFTDGVHLTDLGKYFMASVHYASVYRSSPVGAEGPPGASAATVADLQNIAWNFVIHYYTQPDAGTRAMPDCRTLMQDVCRGYWTLRNNPQNIQSCQNFFASTLSQQNGNPFIWPDPAFQPLPAP